MKTFSQWMESIKFTGKAAELQKQLLSKLDREIEAPQTRADREELERKRHNIAVGGKSGSVGYFIQI